MLGPCPGAPAVQSCTEAALARHADLALAQRPGSHRDARSFARHHAYAREILKVHASAHAREDRASRRKPTTLDIGCGAGFVVFNLRALGADAHGMNAPDHTAPSLLPSWRALGLYPGAVRCAPVLTGQAMPSFGVKFDVVSAFKMQFHTRRCGPAEPAPCSPGKFVRWGAEEWEFWLGSLASHHLNPRASVLLEFINGFGAGWGDEDERVKELLSKLGGRPLGGLGSFKANGHLWLLSGATWSRALRQLQAEGAAQQRGGRNVTQVGWPAGCDAEEAKEARVAATATAAAAAGLGRKTKSKTKLGGPSAGKKGL